MLCSPWAQWWCYNLPVPLEKRGKNTVNLLLLFRVPGSQFFAPRWRPLESG